MTSRSTPRAAVRALLAMLVAIAPVQQAIAQEQKDTPESLRSEAFVAAQYAMISSAAAAVDRMTARFAAGGGALAALEVKRDGIVADLAEVDRHLAALTAAEESPSRAASLSAAIERRRSLRSSLDQLDATIARDFPQYFELTRPRPLEIAEAQRLLNPNEAMLVVLVLDDASYVWAISREKARWIRAGTLGTEALTEKVAALRQSMGVAGARGSIPEDDQDRNAIRLSGGRPKGTFQRAVAYELYRDLVAPLDDVLAGKTVLLTNVSGPLTSIPLALLLTEPTPEGAPLADAPWLGDRFALAELPSVSSLRALRCLLIASKANAHPGCASAAESRNHRRGKASPVSLVGFGAPVLGGKMPDGDAAPPAPADIMRSAAAIPEKLRSLSDLPQAKAELDSLAAIFGPRADVLTGARATEQAVKASATLPNARFVVFSTHGLLATEIGDNAEPGLVLTPPVGAAASDSNDGLLTASEAAQLRLAADLVVLSACNTAASSGKPGAEGLSGLARAFLFAGARSMLVSHWAVSDAATSKLMQETFGELSGGGEGRALALQTAMKKLRKVDGGRFADPRYWAPFSLIGEPVQ